jgi:ribosomal subunit interface protein
MNIHFKTTDITLTEDIKGYTEKKVQKISRMLTEGDENISYAVELRAENKNGREVYRSDITVSAGETNIHAVGRGDTLERAVEASKNELHRRLRRDKKRKFALLRNGQKKIKEWLRFGK